MGKVYVIRKNISLTSSGSGLGTQFNFDNKPLTEDERTALGTFGRLGANVASYAAPFAAGWSALNAFADDSQDDAFSALGRAGMAGVQNYSLMGGYGQRAGAKVGSQLDRAGRYLNRFNNTTSVAPPNASAGDDSIFLVDGENQVAGPASPNPVEAANARLDAISSEEAKEALDDQNALARDDENKDDGNEDVETMGGLRRDNVKVIGRQ